MANIKQQIKRIKTNEKRRLINASFKSSTKTAIKAVEKAVAAGDKEKALVNLSFANKKLDKGQAKGIFHKNFVANHKSQLALLVNKLQ
ncbi:30S ribosomal protein S20 [Paracholeplasma manati]|jgi:small subunit ribosomal protein S20|uniref:Small ribosomal subunit protein bS20 n=1 Tax=Paracholeplasma manati TaxID=591373 RepID=A0ABT2Y5K3_9MOLU|nr:30S ribosomal protein S20 [Paracholeplasma manati]MCV2232024.1 30S ribosomal protein S20 [Paracholeplasma manati]MDG0888822.1 30S ribosomal protein S20 [Paracholeplasma manati]MDX9807193.1 30S ribosomal protein S20 [Acholeplasma sp.]